VTDRLVRAAHSRGVSVAAISERGDPVEVLQSPLGSSVDGVIIAQ
jgi:hypothetical protein